MSRRGSPPPPPLPPRRKKDDTSTKPSAAGSTKGRQAQPPPPPPPLPPRHKRQDQTPTPSDAGSTRAGRAKDPAVAAARAAARKKEGGHRHADAPQEEPEKPARQQHKLKETLRTNPNPNPNDTNTKKDSVFGKLKDAVFGNSDNTKDDKDAEAEDQQNKNDTMKDKERGEGRSARPRNPDSHRRDPKPSHKEGTVKGEGSRQRAPAAESTASPRTNDQGHGARDAGTKREHGTAHGSVRGTKGENTPERREDRRRRDERHQARQHGHKARDPDEQYRTAQEERPERDRHHPPPAQADGEPRYVPERYFSPSELDTGMKCKTCGQFRPQCNHCFQPLQKRHVLSRVRHLDIHDIMDSLEDLDEGSDCEGCGQPIPLCRDCGLPLPKDKILERSKARVKAKA